MVTANETAGEGAADVDLLRSELARVTRLLAQSRSDHAAAETTLTDLSRRLDEASQQRNVADWSKQAADARADQMAMDLAGAARTIADLSDIVNANAQKLALAEHAAGVANAGLQGVAYQKDNGYLIEVEYPVRPKVRSYADRKGSIAAMLRSGDGRYADTLETLLSQAAPLADVQRDGDPAGLEPFWDNGWFPSLDALYIYGRLAAGNPALYVEVGSGNSTKFARRAVRDHGLRTKIVSIDPFPRADIDRLCDEIIRTPFEEVDTGFFDQLNGGDMFFLDNSHRGFQNTDVTVFFTEILPHLNDHVLWGLHDIFLPNDYPGNWLNRYFNEQYYLMAYLHGGAGGDEIEFPAQHISLNQALVAPFSSRMSKILGSNAPSSWGGGAFWMRKASRP